MISVFLPTTEISYLVYFANMHAGIQSMYSLHKLKFGNFQTIKFRIIKKDKCKCFDFHFKTLKSILNLILILTLQCLDVNKTNASPKDPTAAGQLVGANPENVAHLNLYNTEQSKSSTK